VIKTSWASSHVKRVKLSSLIIETVKAMKHWAMTPNLCSWLPWRIFCQHYSYNT